MHFQRWKEINFFHFSYVVFKRKEKASAMDVFFAIN